MARVKLETTHVLTKNSCSYRALRKPNLHRKMQPRQEAASSAILTTFPERQRECARSESNGPTQPVHTRAHYVKVKGGTRGEGDGEIRRPNVSLAVFMRLQQILNSLPTYSSFSKLRHDDASTCGHCCSRKGTVPAKYIYCTSSLPVRGIICPGWLGSPHHGLELTYENTKFRGMPGRATICLAGHAKARPYSVFSVAVSLLSLMLPLGNASEPFGNPPQKKKNVGV